MPRTRRQSRLASQQIARAPESPSVSKTEHEKPVASAVTPKVNHSTFSILGSITQRLPKTPRNLSPTRPNEAEMHPQQHHQTAVAPYDEARWLGFFNMAPHTAPPKQSTSFHSTELSPTPIKEAPEKTVQSPPHGVVSSRDFKFTFRREPSVELSEDAQRLMAESREEAARIRAQLAALPTIPDTDPDGNFLSTVGRKIAQPKSRFSDIHKKTFSKMDSIANHASAWRADPHRLKPANTPLKRSSSKVEISKPTVALKRSPSKAELDNPAVSRSSSKTKSRTLSSVNSGVNSGLEKLSTRLSTGERQAPSAKRVKHVEEDDAGTTRPVQPESPSTSTPRGQTSGLVRSNSGLLRPGFSSATSPTKASMARTQNTHDTSIGASQIPALVRSKTTGNLRQLQQSALPRAKSMKDLKANEVLHKPNPSLHNILVSSSIPSKAAAPSRDLSVKGSEPNSSPASARSTDRIKSILRTPNRRYTRDPLKIAAGTHLATPPKQNAGRLVVPATEPTIKRVDFTASTKDKAEREALKAASAEPEAVMYPDLSNPIADLNRRTTIMTLPAPDTLVIPGAFTFRSEKEISFNTPRTSTIRPVRFSGAGNPLATPTISIGSTAHSPSPHKRKLDPVAETEAFGKENVNTQEEDEQRPTKKARTMSAAKSAPTTPTNTMATKSKLSRLGSAKRTGGLTAARLSMLAKPKKRT